MRKANNKYMKDYNNQKEESYFIYMDVNNLYGYAMMHSLPIGIFQRGEDIESHPFFSNVEEDRSIRYFLEVDLEYTRELLKEQKDLPFCPEYETPPG